MAHEYVPEIAVDREGKEHEVQGWQDDTYGGKLGFWLFMFTEVMMFGSMFLVLTYYFTLHHQDFLIASSGLIWVFIRIKLKFFALKPEINGSLSKESF